MVDFLGAVLAIARTIRPENQKVNPKYIVVKPRILSDHNIWRGVAAIRAVLAFIPPAAIAAPILVLGEMGFHLWKYIALGKEYDQIVFPPIDPNIMRLSVEIDPVLRQHFGHLIMDQNWNQEAVTELEVIYNDFSFMTSFELLRAKYPEVDEEYLKARTDRNRDLLQANLYQVEQEITKVSGRPEIDTNLQDAVEAIRSLIPAMRDWSLFNSEGFEDIVKAIDTIV